MSLMTIGVVLALIGAIALLVMVHMDRPPLWACWALFLVELISLACVVIA